MVTSAGAAGLGKGKKKRKGSAATRQATWDHDNSSESDADNDAHAKATAKVASRAQQGKKEKRALDNAAPASDESLAQNGRDQDSRKRRKGAPKRQRASAGEMVGRCWLAGGGGVSRVTV